MASRNVTDLTQLMRTVASNVRERCLEAGVEILIYCTLRSPEEQARLYRRSRTTAEIRRKIADLKSLGFPEMAAILRSVGPQRGEIGRHVTNAGPGESWHQYREAFDGVPVLEGKLAWNPADERAARAWKVYGRAAVLAGAEWAGNWPTFREFPHIQKRAGSANPLGAFAGEGAALRAMGRI